MIAELVPIARLTQRTQLFECLPLSAKLMAGPCVDRQATAQLQDATGPFAACRNCALGQQVAARVPARAVVAAGTICSRAHCGLVATGVDGLCSKHRHFSSGYGRPASKPKRLPRRPRTTEATTMATEKPCSREGCKRPATFDDLCSRHHAGVVNSQKQKGQIRKRRTAPASDAASPPRLGGRQHRTQRPRPASGGAVSAAVSLEQAVEAVELVETLGWDFARTIADRIRTAARA